MDTNVLVSALIAPRGTAARLLRHPAPFTLVMTPAILAELERVLHYPRLFRRYRLRPEQIADYVAALRSEARLLPDTYQVTGVATDPDDDKFLSCALAAGADAIVSGDRHLRTLGDFASIPIVSPAEMVAFLDSQLGAAGD